MDFGGYLRAGFFAVTAVLVSFFAVSCGGGPDTGYRAGRYEFWSFEKSRSGVVPRGWAVAETGGRGMPGKWKVLHDLDAPGGVRTVALIENENRGHTYNLLLAENTAYRNVEVRVMVRALGGKEDQGGGPVWRAKDADNYYIARWNPLEDNFRVYFVKDGQRKQLGSAEVEAGDDTWHEITITHRDDRIVASLDGKQLITVFDSTFTEPGKIGLWVKADGKTAFDNVSVIKLPGLPEEP